MQRAQAQAHLTKELKGLYTLSHFMTEKDGCFWCVAEIAGTVAACILEVGTGVGIAACVAEAIGAGDYLTIYMNRSMFNHFKFISGEHVTNAYRFGRLQCFELKTRRR